MTSQLEIGIEGRLGVIALNRPEAINALSLGMIEGISAQLTAWQTDPTIRAVLFEGALQGIASIQDRWRIDDEWWREMPVSRVYYQLQLESGRVTTVYRDLAGGGWWEQRY